MTSTIAILVYRPIGSGVASYTVELANCLAKKTSVLLLGYDLSGATLLSSDVVKLNLGSDRWIKDFILGGSDIHYIISMSEMIKRKYGHLLRYADLLHFIQPTLSIRFSGNIVANSWHYYSLSEGLTYFPLAMKNLYKIPVVFYVLQNYLLESIAYRKAKGIIATTSISRDILRAKRLNAFYVPLPVNVPDRSEVKFDVGDRVKIILGERDLDRPRNNVLTFLKAITNLWQKGIRDFSVSLIGNFSSKSSVFACFRKLRSMGANIKILRRLPVNLFLNQLLRNDIYVSIRSIMDQGSYGVLQAMARGNMILASRSPAYVDMVRHGQNGLLVNERSVIEISYALQKVIEDRTLLRNLKQKSFELAKRNHSYDVVASQLIDTYKKLT